MHSTQFSYTPFRVFKCNVLTLTLTTIYIEVVMEPPPNYLAHYDFDHQCIKMAFLLIAHVKHKRKLLFLNSAFT